MNSIVIKPIKTEANYDAALERIASLMDAKTATPEADELEVLATLVESYEAEHYPIRLPNPIAAIRFRMEQAEMSESDLIPYQKFGSKTPSFSVAEDGFNLTYALAPLQSLSYNSQHKP